MTADALLVRPRRGEDAGREKAIPFAEVRQVVAFKRDCYTVDSIRMLLVAGAETVEISEEMSGWEEWIAALPERLPGALRFEEWFFEVAFPAFETRATLLYETQAGSPGA